MKVLQKYRGVIPASLARVGNLIIGFVLIFIISTMFSPVEQGLFYTFLSLSSAQFFFDLGVGVTLANLAGRQIAKSNHHGNEAGRHPLTGIMRFACIWSMFAGLAMLIVIGTIGIFTLRANPDSIPHIEKIWLFYCLIFSLQMIHGVFLRFFEGLGHVQRVAYLRLLLSVLNIIFVSGFVFLGYRMAALPIALALALLFTSITTIITIPEFRQSLRHISRPGLADINWRRDIWPFQRGVAVTWLSGYVVFQAQVPILFWLDGPEAAGRFGMCVQIFQAINSSANIFLTYSISNWTNLIVRNEQARLRNSFWQVYFLSTLVTVVGVLFIFFGLWFLNLYESNIPNRLSDTPIVLIYAAAIVANQLYFAISYYYRAHKQEKVWIQTIIAAFCIICIPLMDPEGFDEFRAVIVFAGISFLILFGGAAIQTVRAGLVPGHARQHVDQRKEGERQGEPRA